jgi:peptide/nickel transport system permease protein
VSGAGLRQARGLARAGWTARWTRTPWAARLGFAILLFYLFVGIAAPWLAPYDPSAYVARSFQAPSPQHPLGTNDVGQDILSELIYGARVSLVVAVAAALLTLVISVLVGTVAGLLGGWTDALLMRVVDVLMIVPRLPLMIVIAAYAGAELETIVLVIALLGWPSSARVVRAQVLSLRCRTQVDAARSFGGGTGHIIRRHLVPELAPILAATFVGRANSAVMMEASLAFLGLGDPSLKSWGSMTRYALNAPDFFFSSRWLWSLLPVGMNLTLLLLGFALLGIGLEEWTNPRMRRHV